MWGRGYWGASYWGEEYWPTGTAGAEPPEPPAAVGGWGDPRIAKMLQKGMRPKKRPRREEVPVPVYELPDDEPDWETIVLALLN